MKKTILTLLLAAVSTSATAEWVKVGESSGDGGYSLLVEPSSIRKSGKLVKMWTIYDYKEPQTVANKTYKSMKTLDQYDCAGEQARGLYGSFHSENMGSGNTIFVGSESGGWIPVSPDSLGEIAWKVACGKVKLPK